MLFHPNTYQSMETLYPMRTQVRIKQYKPNKPAKYGLLFKSLNDARFSTHLSKFYHMLANLQQGEGPYYLNKNRGLCEEVG